jgi:pilus assembly protein CpaB
MNRRALFIALVFSILGVVLLVLYQQRFIAEASGGEKIKILIAVKPIERGKPITDEVLAVREVPLAYVEDRAIKEVEKAKILGLRVGNTVQAQQTLMWTDIVTANEDRRDLSSLVQPGSRAVTIQMSSQNNSVALIKPGDYVDVFSVLEQGPTNLTMGTGMFGRQMSFSSSGQLFAVVLLQKVLVLAAGLETSPDAVEAKDKERFSASDSLLTLSLTVTEAQLIALASEKGRLAVALRNPEDQRTAATISDLPSSALFDVKTRPQTPHSAGGPTVPTQIPGGAER